MRELSARAASELLQSRDTCMLLDVRELWELKIAAIDGAVHIPMQQVPQRIAEIDAARQVIVVCHHGVRSRMVVRYLEQCGHDRVFNLSGGIAAWARDVDRSLAAY